jgi:hypothetical protein
MLEKRKECSCGVNNFFSRMGNKYASTITCRSFTYARSLDSSSLYTWFGFGFGFGFGFEFGFGIGIRVGD